MMKQQLSYGDKCIIARNENEIRVLQVKVAKALRDIEDLRKQNREIIGRNTDEN